MTDQPARPPEAELLRRARSRIRLSIREAAVRVSKAMPPGGRGISEGRLRQIEAGYQTVSAGVRVPTSATAETLAYLAKFYDITPGELESEGQRPDAAEILRDILDRPGPQRPEPAASSLQLPDNEDEAFIAAVVNASPGDREVLESIMRLQDGEGGPMPWPKRRELMQAWLRQREPASHRETS